MVKTTTQQNQTLYQCEVCGFEYKEIENAQQCEIFCNEHNSCSTEIAKHAVFDKPAAKVSSPMQSFLLSGLPVIVDFWAPWCPWCVKLMPIFDEIAKEHQGKADFVKINVEENQDLAAELGVMSIPAIKVFYTGKKIGELAGYMPKEKLASEINKILSNIPKDSKPKCC
ncbi:MAG: thioredoxin family protein [Candidatus Nitrosotenuis sp.]